MARAADEAFATMKDDPAAAQGVLAACRSDVQGLAQAYQTMHDTLPEPTRRPAVAPLTASSPSWARWRRPRTAESAIASDAASTTRRIASDRQPQPKARAGSARLADALTTTS